MHDHPRHVLTIFATADLDRSSQFYHEAFGWPILVEHPVYVEFELPEGRRFGLYQREPWMKLMGEPMTIPHGGALTGAEIYFYCEDIDLAIAKIEAVKPRKLSELHYRDWGDECAYYADPDGNVIVLARPFLPGA